MKFQLMLLQQIIFTVLLGGALEVKAHNLSLTECMEGSDFIEHAAMSRDGGITRTEFMGRMDGDLVLIQQYPAELRWFVQDEEDEVLLVDAARRVFDSPRNPGAHRSEFLAQCMMRPPSR